MLVGFLRNYFDFETSLRLDSIIFIDRIIILAVVITVAARQPTMSMLNADQHPVPVG